MARDCLCLLAYVSKHRAKRPRQSYTRLARATGIPRKSLYNIIGEAQVMGGESMLGVMAEKYGYAFNVKVAPNIIDVEKISDKH